MLRKWSIETLSPMEALCTPRIHEYKTTRILRHVDLGIVMSDTSYELECIKWFVDRAYGNVLIIGLGLGVILEQLKHCRITILEIDQEVVDLVQPDHKVIIGDAYDYRPNENYDCIWIDTWRMDKSRLLRWKKYGTIVGIWPDGNW